MTSAKITTPLFFGIAGTIGFNLSPIVLGCGMPMNVCFVLYAGTMLVLSVADRRVLGYATVLLACNPANALANLSFSFMLAVLTIVGNVSNLGHVIRELAKRRWWWLFLATFALIGLSVPFWPLDLRAMITEVKNALSRLGYLAVLPLAVGLTLRTPRDGVRAMSLLCLMSVAFLVVFFFRGQTGMTVVSAAQGGDASSAEQFIGNVSLNFLRTQVCILLAALAVGSLALGVGAGFSFRAVPFVLALCVSVAMILMLASTGSALAMVGGMGVVALSYFGSRLSLGRILLGAVFFAVVGSALYWAVFKTENALSQRIEEKAIQLDRTGIDRMAFWENGIAEICKTPFGEGWSSRTGHSDYLLFLLSYGWPTGLLYIAAVGSLVLSIWHSLRWHRATPDPQLRTLLMVGLAVLSVYVVNSILDMLSANIGYYETVWALILTPATVVAVTDAAKPTVNCGDFGASSLNRQCRH